MGQGARALARPRVISEYAANLLQPLTVALHLLEVGEASDPRPELGGDQAVLEKIVESILDAIL